jgi:hypothetical protein
MTEDEAKQKAIKETNYCFLLAQAWHGDKDEGICLERIFTKEHGEEEIRLAWWSGGNQIPKPADLDASDWVELFGKAVENGVFTDSEKLGMLKALIK